MLVVEVSQLLDEITNPTVDGVFHVLPIRRVRGYYVGRIKSGQSSVLIRTSGDDRPIPIRLAGLEAVFGVTCELAEPGQPARVETLTVIQCLSGDANIQQFFAFAVEGLIEGLGEAPDVTAVASTFGGLVELFQKLRSPPKRSLTGLIGELIVIEQARSPRAAVEAWRVDPTERFDFSVGRLRIDAKAAANRRRVHSVSFEQANPPSEIVAVFASLFVEPQAGGTSLRDLLRSIEARIGTGRDAVAKLQTVTAATLGRDLPESLKWSFDAALASSSLQFYYANEVPALRPLLPSGVSGVRFLSDCDSIEKADVATIAGLLNANEAAPFPVS